MTPDAFFVSEDDDHWQPTQHAVGPWSPEHLHGGPVAALIARAVERLPTERPRRLVRLHLDFLRPVPLARLHSHAAIEHSGRSVERVVVHLEADGQRLCVARALRNRTEALAVPDTPGPPPDRPPQKSEPARLPVDLPWSGYHTAMRLRVARGTVGAGPVQVWMQPKVALVAGETASPVQRALIAADAASGVSAILDWRAWRFLNGDLDVVFTRPPRGDWVCLDAVTELARDGLGTCSSVLRDADGPFGRSTQALVVQRPR